MRLYLLLLTRLLMLHGIQDRWEQTNLQEQYSGRTVRRRVVDEVGGYGARHSVLEKFFLSTHTGEGTENVHKAFLLLAHKRCFRPRDARSLPGPRAGPSAPREVPFHILASPCRPLHPHVTSAATEPSVLHW